VSDYDHPGGLIDAGTARFVQRSGSTTAMGAGLLAFASEADSAALAARFQAQVLSWAEVRQLAMRDELPSVSAGGHRHVQ